MSGIVEIWNMISVILGVQSKVPCYYLVTGFKKKSMNLTNPISLSMILLGV